MKLSHVAFLLLLLSSGGCAASHREAIRANALVVREESTPAHLLERGDLFAAVGDATRAEQYFAAALAAGGDEAVLVRRLVRVCARDHRFRAAIEYAAEYLRHRPADHDMRFARGALEAAIDDSWAAKGDLERTLADAPNDSEAHFALAVVLRDEIGDRTAADAHFRRYLELSPLGVKVEEARAGVSRRRP